jgi:Tfp pilus assembly protein FimT
MNSLIEMVVVVVVLALLVAISLRQMAVTEAQAHQILTLDRQ